MFPLPADCQVGCVCTLAIFFRVFAQYPVVIAANRDEYLARPAGPPALLNQGPQIVGGQDLVAGGTWLGINEHGVVAGLLNRHSDGANDPSRRSRGLLCLDALKTGSVREAAALIARESATNYNPFNLLAASREGAIVAYNRGERVEIVNLEPGLHLLTNLDIDDFECPKISRAWQSFATLVSDPDFAGDPPAGKEQLRKLLSDHTIRLDSRSRRANAICVHEDAYGTRSSSLIYLPRDMGSAAHFFAPGPPCVTAYAPAPLPGSLGRRA